MASVISVLLINAACFGVAFSKDGADNANGFLSTTTATTTTTLNIVYFDKLVESLPLQHGKCVAITGTTSGLGLWTAIASARKGASCIIMLNRASSRVAAAKAEVEKQAAPGVTVFPVTCDLMNLSSVREAAATVNIIASQYAGLDILALNAGIMAMPDKRTVDGYDWQMQTNHLSHFLLTKLLMPSMTAAAAARGEVRIVTQTSLARGGDPFNATYFMKSPAGSLGGDGGDYERYHQSKLANIVFAMRLHSKFAKVKGYSNFKGLSAAPGIAATNLNVPGKGKIPPWLAKLMANHVLLSAPDGSCSLLTAMYAPSAKSGDFYEPKYMMTGAPYQVIAAGVPAKYASWPRSFCHDELSCSDELGDQVWSASEAGLGEKFIIGESSSVVV